MSSPSSPPMMRAVVAKGAKDYVLDKNVARPIPQVGEVLVQITAVGVCASDGKMYKGGDFYWAPGGRARPGVIVGHEFVGTIVQLGRGAENRCRDQGGLHIGDQVVAEQLICCQKCWFCANGHHNKCDFLKLFGQAVDGAMCDYMIFPETSWIIKTPSLDPYRAVLAEPLAVSVHAVKDRLGAVVNPNEPLFVVVSGCGIIGLGMFNQKSSKAVLRFLNTLQMNRLA